jgi:predicted methyltransferase
MIILLITRLSSLLLCCVPVYLLAQDYNIPENTPPHIRSAVVSTQRSDNQVARDAGRRPAEVLTIADLNEGDHVAEISSFGQYYTEMLVEAVGGSGMVDMYDLPLLAGFQDGNVGKAGQAFADARNNARYQVVDYNTVDFPAGLDMVTNVLSYHDFQAFGVDTGGLNSKVFAALRPGGKYLVIDHKAEDGSGWRDAGNVHRIGKEVIIDEVTSAGFNLIADSALLDNPDDDRSAMVFTVRGQTARALLVFQKPY